MDAPGYGIPDTSRLDATSRRRFLAGGGLLLAFAAVGGSRKAHAAGEEPSLHAIQGRAGTGGNGGFDGFAPGGFIRIPPSGKVVIIAPNVEMGQGIYTGEAMLIAEELEIGLDQLTVVAAPADEALYKQPLLKSQSTGGSTSIRGAWVPLRQAGAAARTMLIAAAAQQWNVPAGECAAERGVVKHMPSGRTLDYGALATAASRLPVPKDVTLKDPKDFRLIGKPAPRVDTPSKVDGSAQFGIDISVPGMKIATVAACPVLGGKLADVDDKAARAVPGVRDIVRLDDAVAVIGDHFWAAKQGLAALAIRWNEGPNAGLSSADLVTALRDAGPKGTPVMARKDGDIDGGFSKAAKKVEAAYELPFLAHATMEPINTLVHVRPDGCDVWVGTQVPGAAQKIAAEAAGLKPEQVCHPQPAPRRRLRPPARGRLDRPGGRDRQAGELPGQGGVDARGGHPARSLPPGLLRPRLRRARRRRHAAGLDRPRDRRLGDGALPPDGSAQGQARRGCGRGRRPAALRLPRDPGGLGARGSADPDHLVARRRAHAQRVRGRELHRRARPCGGQGCGRIPPRAARQEPALRRRAAISPPRNPAGAARCPPGAAAASRCTNSFGSHLAVVVEIAVAPTGEIRLQRIVAAMDCGLTVNPDSVRAQIEGGLVFGLTAALYNDITFRNGRSSRATSTTTA